MCVIPTRNWFIYQKIIRFNAKALRPQIKDKKWWAHWRGPWGERKRRTKKEAGWKSPPPPRFILRFSVYTTHRVPATGTVALGAAQNGLGNKKNKNKRKQ